VQYLGQVRAAGKTPQALRDELQQKLGDGYLKDPIVSVTVTELNSRKLSVLGQVNKTGTIRFTPGMTITEAIAQSGGFSPMARKNNVQVRRTLDGKLVTYTVAVERIAEGENPNMQLMPGDEVFVPERPW
jgi:polysaccharide export outer membrane protein